ncbi:Activator of Hsp90 ATPase homolog 1-like protein [Mycobacteroides abscessus subsp. massiliense]|nr:Activator of Hsp90 ATPase homolog 1-like protein [Mycobacteroides abscessus subsp. massiliense]
MSYERIERELYIDAPPEVVFSVISRPEHMKQWWPDDAEFAPAPGARGQISFHGEEAGEVHVYGLTLVDVEPPRGNSLLVTFELTPSGAGTRVRMTEVGFRDQGRTEAEVVEQYESHEEGWAQHLPRLAPCVGELAGRS